jgi:hypothetical protein
MSDKDIVELRKKWKMQPSKEITDAIVNGDVIAVEMRNSEKPWTPLSPAVCGGALCNFSVTVRFQFGDLRL